MVNTESVNNVQVWLRDSPRLKDILRLPVWYSVNIACLANIRRKALKEASLGAFSVEYVRILAACYCKREYIDAILNNKWDIPELGKLFYANWGIGWTLCDLGYSDEGIEYLEKAISLKCDSVKIGFYTMCLCFRLNARKNWGKRFELVNKLAKDEPENENVQALMAKACLENGFYEEAASIIKKLCVRYEKLYGFLLAELHFAKSEFDIAIPNFEKYAVPRGLYFWVYGYDYKKALTYYNTNQLDKCRVQAAKIKIRQTWDKFYQIENLENIGIAKEIFIDDIITSDINERYIIDKEKTIHYCRIFKHIIHTWYCQHKYAVLIILAIFIFFLLF